MAEAEAVLTFPSADAGPRLDIAGGRVVSRLGFSEVIPDISRSDMSKLQFGTLPHEPALEVMVDRLFPLGSKDADRFFGEKKIVVRNLQDGTQIASVTSNIWDKISKPRPGFSLERTNVGVGGLGQVRRYELAQVLTDSYLLDKFSLQSRHLSTVKTMAVVDATAAAKYMQTLIRDIPGFEKYEVSAGSYTRSKRWARDKISTAKADPTLVPAHIESAIIGDKIFVYGPGDESVRWCVFGPVWYAAEVKSMYAIVAYAGPSQACFAYGIELTLLDIDIMDGGAVLSPSVELHVGPQDALPVASSLVTEEILSVDGKVRLLSMAKSIEPVMVDGEQVACAVRLASDRVLINSHVVSSGGDVEVGRAVVVPQTMVSRDLWIASTSFVAHQMDWTLRTPVVGESVVVCYLRGDRLQYTSPMSVRSTDGSVVVTSLTSDLQPGMSGGALVALHDMALLGVYSGVGAQQAISAAFTQVHYTDMCTADAESEVSRAAAGADRDSQYSRMKARGLGKLLDAALASLVPMYDGGCHVGMAYRTGTELRTTCEMEVAPLTVGSQRENKVFVREDSGAYLAVGLGSPGLVGPSVLRSPAYGEKVFVLGTDEQGPYISDTVRVRHVGVAAKSFFISGMSSVGHLPLVGGLVVAVADGAVVGQCQAPMSKLDMGDVIRCISVAHAVPQFEVTVEEGFAQWLGRTFPMLNPGTWPAELLEEVVTHSSCVSYSHSGSFNVGNRPLAYVGDAAAKLAVGLSLRSRVVPHAKWQEFISVLQSDKALASTCDDLGLFKWIRVGKGVLDPGIKARASILEALIAAVYLQETFSSFEQFCMIVGVTSVDYIVHENDELRSSPEA